MEVTIIEGVSITVCPFCKTVIHTEGDLRDVIDLHFSENPMCDAAEHRVQSDAAFLCASDLHQWPGDATECPFCGASLRP